MPIVSAVSAGSSYLLRAALIGAALAVCVVVAAYAGLRYGVLLLIGVGFGITLEGLRFGFSGAWRAMILRREPQGLLAQLLAIALVALIAFPLLASNEGELTGAHAPVGVAMIAGAFFFGVAMQVVLACGSGTLVNAGSGNLVGLITLPFFAIGSFAGAVHLLWWTEIGSLPVIALEGGQGLLITLAGVGLIAGLAIWRAGPASLRLPRRLVIGAVLVATLSLANLVVAGQPWGVVYGLGLWVAKAVTAAGADLSASPFWSAPGNVMRIQESLLTDVTSLTNLGIISGAFLVVAWRGTLGQPLPRLPLRAWAATIIAGLVLGYSSRLAFGCNIGAFFSGISTGSLHGWVWLVAAFAGSVLGVRIRSWAGFEAR